MKIHLLGIKGSGMSALSALLKEQGHDVQGSDVEQIFFTDKTLKEKEINVYSFSEENITPQLDLVIVGNAFSFDHIEVKKAQSLNINIMRYYEVLDLLSSDKKVKSIAISGTNGKTTTTGLIKDMMKDQKINYLIGDGTGGGNNNADYFIFEACEYKNTFLNYHPDVAVINNIEMDHPDFFQNIDHVIETYQSFADLAKEIIINGDDQNCLKIKHQQITSFGLKKNNGIYAKNINYLTEGTKMELVISGKVHQITVPYYGEYMVYNLLGAVAAMHVIGLDDEKILTNIKSFTGVNRRFSEYLLSEKNNIHLIDDYAHHPTSINLLIKAIRQKYPKDILTVIFQAHTYSRVEEFKEQFARELAQADRVMISPIFGSIREKENTMTEHVINNELERYQVEILKNLEEVAKIEKNHVICLIGAGNIDKIYLETIREKYVNNK